MLFITSRICAATPKRKVESSLAPGADLEVKTFPPLAFKFEASQNRKSGCGSHDCRSGFRLTQIAVGCRQRLCYTMQCQRAGSAVYEPLRHGGTCVSSRCGLEKRQVWPNIAARRLVAFPDCGLSRLRRVSGLCQLGGVPEQPLHL